jgi:hypothetical protein
VASDEEGRMSQCVLLIIGIACMSVALGISIGSRWGDT